MDSKYPDPDLETLLAIARELSQEDKAVLSALATVQSYEAIKRHASVAEAGPQKAGLPGLADAVGVAGPSAAVDSDSHESKRRWWQVVYEAKVIGTGPNEEKLILPFGGGVSYILVQPVRHDKPRTVGLRLFVAGWNFAALCLTVALLGLLLDNSLAIWCVSRDVAACFSNGEFSRASMGTLFVVVTAACSLLAMRWLSRVGRVYATA